MTGFRTAGIGRRLFLHALGVGALAGTPTTRNGGVLTRSQGGLVLTTWERSGYRDGDGAAALRGMGRVGAEWVQFVPTWYQTSPASTEISPTDESVDDDNVRFAIDVARAEGLKILLKPHVDVLDGGSRSRIAPRDRDGWFASYRSFIGRYADLARDTGIEQFAVGTELGGLSDDRARWLGVVDDVRGRYDGQLVYAANHDEYRDVAFWDAVDLVGIDVYWPLVDTATSDVAVLTKAFAPIRDELAVFARSTGRRILFTEAGYASVAGSATAPFSDRQSTDVAEDEQAAAYRALLDTFTGQRWWAGVFWWTWTVPHAYSLDVPLALDHSVRGKAAEDVLRAAWDGSV